MHNLKRKGGTFKGLAGECMFKLSRGNVLLTRFHSRKKELEWMSKYLTKEQADFLFRYWYSLDALNIEKDEKGMYLCHLYEVKMRNDTSWKKLCITKSSFRLYLEAIKLGFKISQAEVILFHNWNYEVVLSRFDPGSYHISARKIYDN